MSRPVIIAFGRPTSGVHYHRIIAPLLAMGDEAEVYIFQYIQEVPLELLNKATHFLLSRVSPFGPVKDIKALFDVFRKGGARVMVDVDDWWHFPHDHPNRDTWKENDHEGRCIATMTHADEVWCTGKDLAKKVRRYNKNAVIVPNGVDTNSMQWNQPKIKSDKVRFGYIGGHYHQKDLEMTGLDLSSYESYAVDIGGYPEILNTKYKLGAEPPNRYGLLYSSIDVSLVPLIGSDFASCKSNLKLIEAAYTNTAVIVSDVKPYKGYITRSNAIIADDDWGECVRILGKVNDFEYINVLANNLRETMAEFSLDKVNDIRLNRLAL